MPNSTNRTSRDATKATKIETSRPQQYSEKIERYNDFRPSTKIRHKGDTHPIENIQDSNITQIALVEDDEDIPYDRYRLNTVDIDCPDDTNGTVHEQVSKISDDCRHEHDDNYHTDIEDYDNVPEVRSKKNSELVYPFGSMPNITIQ